MSMPTAALPTRSPATPGELDKLDATLSELTELFSVLRDKLDPVLVPSTPQPAPPAPPIGDPSAAGSTVASRIRESSDTVTRLTARMRDVLGRVDV